MTPQTPDTGPSAADDELAARAVAATRDSVTTLVIGAMGSAHHIGSRIGHIVRQISRRRGE